MNRIKRTIEKKIIKNKRQTRERQQQRKSRKSIEPRKWPASLAPNSLFGHATYIIRIVSPRSERIDQDSTRIEANFAESGHSLRKEKRDEVTWPRERAPPTLSTGGRGRRKSARGSIPPPLFCNHPRLAAVCRRQCI